MRLLELLPEILRLLPHIGDLTPQLGDTLFKRGYSVITRLTRDRCYCVVFVSVIAGKRA